jgi:hypothetical protein
MLDSSKYGNAVEKLLSSAPLNELGPGMPVEEHEQALMAVEASGWPTSGKGPTPDDARACVAALWLRFDFQDRAHEISQAIESPLGSYVHGIVHRREPDFSNARYWFRRVARLPFFNALQAAAQADLKEIKTLTDARVVIESATWEPLRFVDLCESASGVDGALTAACRRVQLREWELLFDHCFTQATSASK